MRNARHHHETQRKMVTGSHHPGVPVPAFCTMKTLATLGLFLLFSFSRVLIKSLRVLTILSISFLLLSFEICVSSPKDDNNFHNIDESKTDKEIIFLQNKIDCLEHTISNIERELARKTYADKLINILVQILAVLLGLFIGIFIDDIRFRIRTRGKYKVIAIKLYFEIKSVALTVKSIYEDSEYKQISHVRLKTIISEHFIKQDDLGNLVSLNTYINIYDLVTRAEALNNSLEYSSKYGYMPLEEAYKSVNRDAKYVQDLSNNLIRALEEEFKRYKLYQFLESFSREGK